MPVVDWYKDDPKAAKTRERRRRQLAVFIFVLVILPAGGAELYRRNVFSPPKAKEEKVSAVPAPADPFQLMAEKHRKERAREFGKIRQRPVEEEKATTTNVQRLKEDILNIGFYITKIILERKSK